MSVNDRSAGSGSTTFNEDLTTVPTTLSRTDPKVDMTLFEMSSSITSPPLHQCLVHLMFMLSQMFVFASLKR
ncbi:hypothetical protein BDZ89DRAFT_1075709 [Hymenopellis radicata]|nr:hypothetical protein BDZ89DRAFT_1075709 [Hymenopellis radicata]